MLLTSTMLPSLYMKKLKVWLYHCFASRIFNNNKARFYRFPSFVERDCRDHGNSSFKGRRVHLKSGPWLRHILPEGQLLFALITTCTAAKQLFTDSALVNRPWRTRPSKHSAYNHSCCVIKSQRGPSRHVTAWIPIWRAEATSLSVITPPSVTTCGDPQSSVLFWSTSTRSRQLRLSDD